MHDSRWEEDEEEEVDEKDKTLPVEEKEKETCVEKTVRILVALQNFFFFLVLHRVEILRISILGFFFFKGSVLLKKKK